jgi:hypothetical protein
MIISKEGSNTSNLDNMMDVGATDFANSIGNEIVSSLKGKFRKASWKQFLNMV